MLGPKARGKGSRPNRIKQFCRHGHDTFVCGRKSDGDCVTCYRARGRIFAKKDRIKRREYDKKHRYGIGYKEIHALLASQSYLCSICSSDITSKHFVDHNHTTNKVRELLCPLCNSGLGFFRDSPELLRLAASYLDKHGAT